MSDPPAPAPSNPFPGLRPFRSDEKHLFFGREDQTGELLQRLRQTRFLAVVGPSGSGKSSLVRAGLLPELHGGTMTAAGSHWEVVLMRPGGAPLTNLSKALVAADLYDPEEPGIVDQVRTTLDRSALGLAEAVRQSDADAGTNILVVVDQFEEIFRFREQGGESTDEAAAFIKLLLEASRQDSPSIYVVLTMRSDYLGDCAQFRGLAEAVNDGEYLIPRLTRAQRRSAIEGPIQVGGAAISKRLLTKLLNDVGDDPDQLPVLQHALMRTWTRWEDEHRPGEEVDLRHYEATGGMQEALSRHADEVYAALPSDATRAAAERAFKALTEKVDDHRGIRRPMRLQRLIEVAGAAEDDILTVIEAYRAHGCTFLMPPEPAELKPRTMIDISHESLMRVWKRLRRWVDDESQSAGIYRRLVETTRLHAAGKAGLYHDPDLSIAQAWREEASPNAAWAELYGGEFDAATSFLEASREAAARAEREREEARLRELKQAQTLAETQMRAARVFKRFAVGVAAVAALALIAFAYALVAGIAARKAEDAARDAQTFAEGEQRKAEASAIEAREARERLRHEFVRSDQSLAETLVGEGLSGRAIAHLARSLKPDYVPDNPAVVDQIFHLLAYASPPAWHDVPRDYGNALVYATAATRDASRVATAVWGAASSRIRVWAPGSGEPVLPDAGNAWHRGLAFSPDGTRLFSGKVGDDGAARVFDTRTWEKLFEIPETGVPSGEFSADGRRLLIGSHNTPHALIVDAFSGEVLHELPLSGLFPTWSPDESRVAWGSVVIDISNERVTDLTRGESAVLPRSAWNPDGRRLLTSSPDAVLHVWDPEHPAEPLFGIAHEATPIGVLPSELNYFGEEQSHIGVGGSFSPDGQRIVSVGTDLTVRLWDANDGTLLDQQPLPQLPKPPYEVRFSTDGRRMMIEFRDGRCWVAEFDSAAGTLPLFGRQRSCGEGYAFLADDGSVRPLLLPQGEVTAAAIVHGENAIVIGTSDGLMRMFDLTTGDPRGEPMVHEGGISALAASGDGSRIAAGSSSGSVGIWDSTTFERVPFAIEPSPESAAAIVQLAFSRDGRELAVFGRGGVSVWDAIDGRRLRGERSRQTASMGVAGAEGTVLASTADAVVEIRERATLTLISRIAHDFPVTAMALSPDESLLATAVGGGENHVRLWRVKDGSPAGPPMTHAAPVVSLAFSADGSLLAAGTSFRRAHLWSAPSGQSLDRLPITGAGRCSGVALNADGSLLATVFDDGTDSFARIWEVSTGRAVTGMLGVGARISEVEFLESGSRLLAWSRGAPGGIAAIWDVSVSEGRPSPDWFPAIAEGLGGFRLDDQSIPQSIDDPSPAMARIRDLRGDSRLEKFLRWQAEFPGTRPDSPFRPHPSPEYLELLGTSASYPLLDDAVRLAPDDGRALALRAAARPGIENDLGAQTLSRADLIRARLLAPDDPAVAWCAGAAHDRMGDGEAAAAAYARARQLGAPEEPALSALIAIQERFECAAPERRFVLSAAIDAIDTGTPAGQNAAVRARVRRFILAIEDGTFEEAREDWDWLKEVETPPRDVDLSELLGRIVAKAEAEAERLAGEGRVDEAVSLARPFAAIAEARRIPTGEPGDSNDWTASSILSKLVEWANVDDPPVTIVPLGSTWKYLDDGSDQGTAWREPGFDDSAWRSGPARLGYGRDGEVTTVGFGPDDRNKHITTYFRTDVEVSESLEGVVTASIDLVRDDGAIVYLNGTEIIRDNMPAGTITFDTTASSPISGRQQERAVTRFQIDPSLLKPAKNVLAAEIHQTDPNSSDLGFDLRLLVSRHSPAEYIKSTFMADGAKALLQEAIDLVPAADRATEAVNMGFVMAPEIPDGSAGVPDRSWVIRFDTHASLGRWDRALDTAEQRIALLSGAFGATVQRQIKDWLKRKEVALVQLERPKDEIDSVREQIFAAPPRDPSRDAKQIDLTRYYNASLYDSRGWLRSPFVFSHLSNLPEEFEPRHQVDFDIRGVIQLDSGPLPNTERLPISELRGVDIPDRVDGIAIGMPSPAIHFLMSTQWGREDEGNAVAKFVIHYADGSTAEKEILFGEHVNDWWARSGGASVPSQNIGWRGWIGANQDREVVISEIVWENPHPDKTIESIDFVSTKATAAPFLLAITLE